MAISVLDLHTIMPVYPSIRVTATTDPADNVKVAIAEVHLAGDANPLQYNGADARIIAYAVTGGVDDVFSFDVAPILRAYFDAQNDNGAAPDAFEGTTIAAIAGACGTPVSNEFEVWVKYYTYVDAGGYYTMDYFDDETETGLIFFNGLWAYGQPFPSKQLSIQANPAYTAMTMRPFYGRTPKDGVEFLHFWLNGTPDPLNAFKVTARNGNTSVYTQTITHGVADLDFLYLAVGYSAIRTGYATGGGLTVVASTGAAGGAITDWDIQMGKWAAGAFTALGTKYTFVSVEPCADALRLHFLNRFGVQDSLTFSQKFTATRGITKAFFTTELPTDAAISGTQYGRGQTGGQQSMKFTAHYLCPPSELDWVMDLILSSQVRWQTTAYGDDNVLVPVTIVQDSLEVGDNVSGYCAVTFDVVVSLTDLHP